VFPTAWQRRRGLSPDRSRGEQDGGEDPGDFEIVLAVAEAGCAAGEIGPIGSDEERAGVGLDGFNRWTEGSGCELIEFREAGIEEELRLLVAVGGGIEVADDDAFADVGAGDLAELVGLLRVGDAEAGESAVEPEAGC
jgi:hypothetical protein